MQWRLMRTPYHEPEMERALRSAIDSQESATGNMYMTQFSPTAHGIPFLYCGVPFWPNMSRSYT